MAQYFQINANEFAFATGYLESIPHPTSLTSYGDTLTHKFKVKLMSNAELAIARANAKLLSSQGKHLEARNAATGAIATYFSSLGDTVNFSSRQGEVNWLLDVKNALANTGVYSASDLAQISVSLEAVNAIAGKVGELMNAEYGIYDSSFISEMFNIIRYYYEVNGNGNLYGAYGMMSSQITPQKAAIRHIQEYGVFNSLQSAVDLAGSDCAYQYSSIHTLNIGLANKTAERDVFLAENPADEAIINEEFAVVLSIFNSAIAYHTNGRALLLEYHRNILNKANELQSYGGWSGPYASGYSGELAELDWRFWMAHAAITSMRIGSAVGSDIRDWASLLRFNAYSATSNRFWLASDQVNGRSEVDSTGNALSLANAKLANAITNGLTSMVPALEAEVATAEAAVESALSVYNSQLASIANSLFNDEVEAQYSFLKLWNAYEEAKNDGISSDSNPPFTSYNAEYSISAQKALEIAQARIAAEAYEQQ